MSDKNDCECPLRPGRRSGNTREYAAKARAGWARRWRILRATVGAMCVLVMLEATGAHALEFPAKPPSDAPHEGATAAQFETFWSWLRGKAANQVEDMIRREGPGLGYQRADYNPGDIGCMTWFAAWASVSTAIRRGGAPLPPSFATYLERKKDEACHDDDGPGAPTGRGWNTIRRVTLGRTDVQRVSSTSELAGQAVEAFVALGLGVAEEWSAVAGGLVVPPVPPLPTRTPAPTGREAL